MTKLRLPMAFYADCLPTGEFVAGQTVADGSVSEGVTTTHLVTHQGVLNLPPASMDVPGWRVQHNRLTMAGGLQIVSQGHNDAALFHYHDGAWHTEPPVNGTQGAIFRPDGTIERVEPGPHVESQGIRYWDSFMGPVYGSPTYNSTTPLAQTYGITRLYGWTKLGDLAIGQGDNGGAVFLYHGQHYLLVDGDTQFIQGKRTGDRIAIAVTRFAQLDSWLFWLDVSEIPSLPIYPAVVQPPTQPPTIPPIPPTEPPMFRYDLSPLDAYAQPRWNQLPHGTREEQAHALLRILHEFRAKGHPEIEVYRKAGGTGIIGSDGHLYAEDILVIVQSDGKWWSDVGVAFGAPSAHLVFNGNGFLLTNEPHNCFPPPAPAGEQPPTKPPIPPKDEDLPDRFAALEEQVGDLEDLTKDQGNTIAVQGMHIQEQAAAIMLLAGRVTRLEEKPPGGGTFHPDDWKVETPIRFIGTATGSIKAK